MLYSVNLLTTSLLCEALLASKQKDRAVLLNRQSNLQLQLTYFGNGGTLEAELASLVTQIASQQTFVAGLPEGDDKRTKENELLRLQIRRNTLVSRADNYGVVALIEKEHDLALVTVQLTENAELIAAVEARKAAL